MAEGGSSRSEFETWKEWEYKQNEKFEDIPIHSKDVAVLSIVVISCKDIQNNSSLRNFFDAPNPQVILEYDAAKGPTKFKTSTIVDTYNPVWNESFAFILPDNTGLSEGDGDLTIEVVDNRWILSATSLGKAELNTSGIHFGERIEMEIPFENKRGSVKLKIAKDLKKTDVRLSLSLSESEMEFRIKRIPRVMKACQETFGDNAPKNLFETPIMSIVGSGGGYRAMIGMCGAMEGLEKLGLLDCMTYAFGTSGSSWYLTSAYARKAFARQERQSYHSWLRESLQTSSVWEALKKSNISKCKTIFERKGDVGQPFTLVDYYGICIANKVVGEEFASTKLSDIRAYVETADVPYLIVNASQVLNIVKAWEYRADCSLSPHELEIPHYGVNVDTSTLNSEYHSGVVGRKLPEPDLSFIIGTLGSVFGVSLNRIFGIHHYDDEEILDNAGNPDYFASKEEDVSTPFWTSMLEWLRDLPTFQDRNALIERTGKVLNVVRGFDNMKRFSINPAVMSVPEAVDGFKETEEILSLVDGGILCNVAVDAALRPQRRNDILFVYDFSCYRDGVDHTTLKSTKMLAEEGGYKFPPINIERIKEEDLKELYVFEDEDDPECPIVFWFMLSTRKFRQEQNYRPRNVKVLQDLEPGENFVDFEVYKMDTDYDTFNAQYTALEFERLRELMYYNVVTNEKIIKSKICQKIANKGSSPMLPARSATTTL